MIELNDRNNTGVSDNQENSGGGGGNTRTLRDSLSQSMHQLYTHLTKRVVLPNKKQTNHDHI